MYKFQKQNIKYYENQKNNSQDMKNNDINDYNYSVFAIYTNLYILSKKIEIFLNRPFQIKGEYYLISLDWLKEFKNKFHFKDFETFLELHYDSSILDNKFNNKNYIKNKYIEYKKSKFNKNNHIKKNEFDTINKIKNEKIFAENKNLNLKYYQNFAIVNKKIVEELKNNNFYYDTDPKIDIYLGNHNFIFDVNLTCLECVFCQDYDNYNDEFLINYIEKEYKKKAENEIIKNGLEYYFNINKINRNSYENQYIYDLQTSKKIAIVNNINSKKKKEIIDSINISIQKCYEEALSESRIEKKREDVNTLDIINHKYFF